MNGVVAAKGPLSWGQGSCLCVLVCSTTCLRGYLSMYLPMSLDLQGMSSACASVGWRDLSAVLAALAGMAGLDAEPPGLLMPLCQVGY